MDAREMNVFLTRAALLDPRMKRTNPTDQADMATAWSETLGDVPLDVAVTALTAHYQASIASVMPAHIMDFYRATRKTSMSLEELREHRRKMMQ